MREREAALKEGISSCNGRGQKFEIIPTGGAASLSSALQQKGMPDVACWGWLFSQPLALPLPRRRARDGILGLINTLSFFFIYEAGSRNKRFATRHGDSSFLLLLLFSLPIDSPQQSDISVPFNGRSVFKRGRAAFSPKQGRASLNTSSQMKGSCLHLPSS